MNLGREFLDAGIKRLMVESKGIIENVDAWRTDTVSRITKERPPERSIFEEADPKVLKWTICELSVDVKLFVDHSQIVQ